MKIGPPVAIGFLAAILFVISTPAQPSGGPYGPLALSYSPPADAGHIYFVAQDGRPDATGTKLDEPTTIESAIARAVTGDAIVMRGGTYRTGNLTFNQAVTIQPYADERPVLKGTKVPDRWEAQSNGLWRIAWPTLFPSKPADWWRREREGKRTPLYLFNDDMVFVDGQPLRTVGWEGDVDEHSFSVDYDAGRVYIGVNPAEHLVEITAFNSALTRTTRDVHGKTSDHKGPTIRGITVTQYAFRALEIEGEDPEGVSPESEHGKDVIGTTLENCEISFCSRVAGYFRGDKMTIRHCLISDTSTEGVFVLASNDVLLEGNIFRRNNVEHITGYFPAAVKIFNQCHRVICRDNLVMDLPDSNGIWYDVGNVDGVFVNNWVEGALDGFFFEISKGAICAGNVFVNCDKGILVLNSCNVRAYHNTLFNSVASFERTERSAIGDHFGWHPRTGPDVDQREGHVFTGNVLAADESFRKPLLRFEQTPVLCGKLTRPQVTQLDHNLFVRSDSQRARDLIVWSPADGDTCTVDFAAPEKLHEAYPQFAANSRTISGLVFKSPALKNFEFARPVPASVYAPLPTEAQSLLGWPAQESFAPGAYPAPR